MKRISSLTLASCRAQLPSRTAMSTTRQTHSVVQFVACFLALFFVQPALPANEQQQQHHHHHHHDILNLCTSWPRHVGRALPFLTPQPKRQKNDAHVDNPHSNGADQHPAQHQVGTGTEGKHDWKKRPPYRVHEANENFPVKLTGSCHCGTVEFQLSREEPLDSKLCHCTTCQKQHAAPFQWAAIFHKDDINFSKGHHNLEWYDPTDKSVEHKLPCKVRCSYCHSPIMDEGRNMILLFPSLIDLKTAEDRKKFRPRLHMFYDQRVVDVPDGLPKWTGLNEESDLIEDSPADKVREVARKQEQEREKRFEQGKNE